VPEQRTRVREQGLTGARNSNAEFILSAICSAITSGGKPANARLVAAAIRDTRVLKTFLGGTEIYDSAAASPQARP